MQSATRSITHTHTHTHFRRESRRSAPRTLRAHLDIARRAAIAACFLIGAPTWGQECEDIGTAPVSVEGETFEGTDGDCSMEEPDDVLYKVEIPYAGRWRFSLCMNASFDTLLFVGTTCCGEDWCNDDGPGCHDQTSELTIDIDSGEYYVRVTGFSEEEFGTFTLTIEPPEIQSYRVTDLGVIGFQPMWPAGDTFGINDKGQVAFAAIVEEEMHAMVWLPAADYGLAAGVHDLSELSEAPTDAIARAINESGLVAGEFTDEEVVTAIVWDLNDTEEYQDLGRFQGASFSRAFDISDADPPVVVGDSGENARCYDDCEEGDFSEATRAFRVVLDATPTLEALEPLTCLPSSYGRAVNSSGLLGGAVNRDRLGGGDPCYVSDECTNDRRATSWSNPSTPVELVDGAPRGSEVRAINEAGEMAGFRLDPEGSPCTWRPVFWSSPSSFTELIVPGIPAQGWAEGLNDETAEHVVQVVGGNTSHGIALFWDLEKGEGIVLRDVSAPDTNLNRAHDINASSWIVADGLNDGDYHAYVLVPVNRACPFDLDGSGVVDFDDLLIVLGTWGPCPEGLICRGDATMDGVVDFDDILAVLGAWGPCPQNGGSASAIQTIVEGAGLDWPEDWEEFLEVMETESQAAQENYACWIDHYFYAHYEQTCFCSPNCPGADPYGNH